MFQTTDTIVAISTAAGSAARAIVRLSGDDALPLASSIFESDGVRLDAMGGFRVAEGRIRLTSPPIELPARAYVFRRPRSYTKQDVVELHIPGPAAASAAIVSALLGSGARRAAPGEFTARAFLAGRIDLSEAEAVADVISAADEAQLRSAAASLGGQVHRLCRHAAEGVADVLASVEASIDLAGEDIALESPSDLADSLADLVSRLQSAAGRAAQMPETADRPGVTLTGRSNVGKSSLLNALSGTDRAIISALAGTTRDVLSAEVRLEDGSSFVLQDAAGFGVGDTPLARATDTASRRAVMSADVLVLVVDLTSESFAPDLDLLRQLTCANRRAPVIPVANKLDLLDASVLPGRVGELEGLLSAVVLATSALRGEGLGRLRREIASRLGLSAGRFADALGLHDRQRRCLLAAAAAADRAAGLLTAARQVADCAELVAVDLREALAELGAVSGEVVSEEILGRVFSRFCVGK